MSETYLPVVPRVAVIGGHVLRMLFSDGTVCDVDLSAERWTGVLEPLNDPAFFGQVTVDAESGTVAWPGGIDLVPAQLYEQVHACPPVAARPVVRGNLARARRGDWADASGISG